MTNVDSQRIKEIRDNTKAMAEAFSSIANTLANALELFIATQTETQNSNLTFEKDECAKEYEELGLKELKELIEADRKTEPQEKEVEWVYNKRERPWYPYSNGELLFKTENSSEIPNNCECEPRKEQNFCGKCRYLYRDFKYGLSCYRLMDNEPCKYEERKDEPQTDCDHKCIQTEIGCEKTDCSWK